LCQAPSFLAGAEIEARAALAAEPVVARTAFALAAVRSFERQLCDPPVALAASRYLVATSVM